MKEGKDNARPRVMPNGMASWQDLADSSGLPAETGEQESQRKTVQCWAELTIASLTCSYKGTFQIRQNDGVKCPAYALALMRV